MTFTLDTEVARVLQAALEKNGPPPAPPAGDVQTRRVTLDAMLEYFNNQAQPPADDVIDPARIAVMGDSAGGGLAAGTAILSRDRHGPAIARQLLLYPMLDDRTTTPDPYIAPFAGWSYDDNATGWNALLGTGHENRDIDPAAAPGRLKDARGLPPAYIEVGQLDVFRDESLRYGLTLSQSGVPVELHLHPGVPHEYDAIAFDADTSRRAQADRDRVLRSL